jgi:hypothetical protein
MTMMDEWGPAAMARRAAHATATRSAPVPKWQRMLVDAVARALAEGAGTPTDGFVVTVGPVGHPTRGNLMAFPGCVNARPVLGIPAGCLFFDGFDLARPASRDGPAREGIMLHLRYRSTPWGEIVDPRFERPVVVRDSNGDSLWDQADFDAFPDAPEPEPVEPRPSRNDRLDGPKAPPGTLGAMIDAWRTSPPVLAEGLIRLIGERLVQVGEVIWRGAIIKGGLDDRGHGYFAMRLYQGTETERCPPDYVFCREWNMTWAGDVPSMTPTEK